jgi:hypothetical protein
MLSMVCPPEAQAALDAALLPYVTGGDPGLAVGYAAADALIPEIRGTDTTIPLPYLGGTEPGQWRPTGPGELPMAFVYLATTTPFVLESPSQFRPGPPPALGTDLYRREYAEVYEIGSVDSHPDVSACPAPKTTDMARFYSGNFVAQWNEATRGIAIDRQLRLGDTARLLALANLAAADAAIAVWESKVYYNWWRPVTAIRENDDDPKTVQDPAWTPFIESTVHFPVGSQTLRNTPLAPMGWSARSRRCCNSTSRRTIWRSRFTKPRRRRWRSARTRARIAASRTPPRKSSTRGSTSAFTSARATRRRGGSARR